MNVKRAPEWLSGLNRIEAQDEKIVITQDGKRQPAGAGQKPD
jgi:hypothetical protein